MVDLPSDIFIRVVEDGDWLAEATVGGGGGVTAGIIHEFRWHSKY
jgi:hypothetical protein